MSSVEIGATCLVLESNIVQIRTCQDDQGKNLKEGSVLWWISRSHPCDGMFTRSSQRQFQLAGFLRHLLRADENTLHAPHVHTLTHSLAVCIITDHDTMLWALVLNGKLLDSILGQPVEETLGQPVEETFGRGLQLLVQPPRWLPWTDWPFSVLQRSSRADVLATCRHTLSLHSFSSGSHSILVPV
eukprot:2930909-Amphidinium_carterae.2